MEFIDCPYTMEQLDSMEGHQFEYAVADLLMHSGYRDVKVTQGSGDYGVDILARKGKIRYAIQCKRYSGSVGVKAIQEAATGAEFYHYEMAAVITNSHYTKQAINLAQSIGVRLWDGAFIEELIENYDPEYDELMPPIEGIENVIPNRNGRRNPKIDLDVEAKKDSLNTRQNDKSIYIDKKWIYSNGLVYMSKWDKPCKPISLNIYRFIMDVSAWTLALIIPFVAIIYGIKAFILFVIPIMIWRYAKRFKRAYFKCKEITEK